MSERSGDTATLGCFNSVFVSGDLTSTSPFLILCEMGDELGDERSDVSFPGRSVSSGGTIAFVLVDLEYVVLSLKRCDDLSGV